MKGENYEAFALHNFILLTLYVSEAKINFLLTLFLNASLSKLFSHMIRFITSIFLQVILQFLVLHTENLRLRSEVTHTFTQLTLSSIS
jgi:hypothetical protein